MEACFSTGKARTDLLCAPCTLVPQVFGRVNYSGSYLYSFLLEGDVERWRDVLYFIVYSMQRSKSSFQTRFTTIQLILLLLHFFMFFCTTPNYFYAFDFCISNTNTQRK